MKILYAVQRTGNGHIARAQEIIPILQKYAEVEILASGFQAQISLGCDIRYSYKGISLFYNKKGGIDVIKTLFLNNFFLFIYHVLAFPVKEYDLIINDFEPITAWACKFKGGNILSLSHQASMWFKETPRPRKLDVWAMRLFQYYAPIKKRIGFHFESYHPDIYLPIIRKKIRELTPSIHDHYLVYLPSYSDIVLHKKLSQIDTTWIVFSKQASVAYQLGNCHFYPIDERVFLETLASCEGVLCNAGFELPAESLFLKKKLFVLPIKKQFEQAYNAKALSNMGVPIAKKLKVRRLAQWVNQQKRITVEYPDQTEAILMRILAKQVDCSPSMDTYNEIHLTISSLDVL